MSDFIAWEDAWSDYAQCQHLASQDRETGLSALRSTLDEDIRRFIRQGVISLPPNPDVPDVLVALKLGFVGNAIHFSTDWIFTSVGSKLESRLTHFSHLFTSCRRRVISRTLPSVLSAVEEFVEPAVKHLPTATQRR